MYISYNVTHSVNFNFIMSPFFTFSLHNLRSKKARIQHSLVRKLTYNETQHTYTTTLNNKFFS